MKKILIVLTAFILSVGSACAQNAKFVTLKPAQQMLQQSSNAPMQTSAHKAPRKIELGENQHIFGAYSSDALCANGYGLGLPTLPGELRVASWLPAALAGGFDGGKVVKIRFGIDQPVDGAKVFLIAVKGDDFVELCSQDLKNAVKGWNEVTLDEPYTLDNEGVDAYLLGFNYIQVNTNDGQYYSDICYPLSFANEGVPCDFYTYGNLGNGIGWYNFGTDYGNLSVQAVIEKEFPENAAAPFGFEELTFALGEEVNAPVTVMNQGTEPLNSFTYTVATNEEEPNYENEIKLEKPITDFGVMTTLSLPLPGDEVTGQALKTITITKVNGVENGNIKATCQGIISTVSKIVPKAVVMEEYTGTGCGWCPRGLAGMQKLRDTFGDLFIGLALHWYNTSDAMSISRNAYAPLSFSGAPSCYLSRSGVEIDPFYGSGDDICYDVQNHLDVPAKAAVSLIATWNDDKTMVDAQATVETVVDNTSYTVEFVLVADQLTGTGSGWNQSNYYAQYTAAQAGADDYLAPFCKEGTYGTSTIKGFKFNDVVIAGCYTQGKIQVEPLQNMKIDEPQTMDFSLKMPTKTTLKNAIKKDEVYAVALVIDDKGHITNAAKVKVEEKAQPNAIDNTTLTHAESARYSISGTQLTAPQKGVNIVRMADGRVVKTIEK